MKRIAVAVGDSSVEAYLAVLCLLVGVPILFSPESFAPRSSLEAISLPLIYTWGVTLTVGGVLTLAGIAAAPRVEQAGVALLAGAAGVFGIVVAEATTSASNALLVLVTYLGFSAAMIARYFRIGRLARIVRAARMAEHRAGRAEP